MKQSRRNKQRTERQAPAGWRAASFQISTTDGWLEVDGMVRQHFGVDQRAADEAGNGSWFVTHLPSGRAVVTQVRVLTVALAFVDRIAALTDWAARDISATADLRDQVREALNQAYGDFFADRLPELPEDASSAAWERAAVHRNVPGGRGDDRTTGPAGRSFTTTKA
jgi:hypothetical protein